MADLDVEFRQSTPVEQECAVLLALHRHDASAVGPGACACGWRSVRFSWEVHAAEVLATAGLLRIG